MIILDINDTEVVYSGGVWSSNNVALNGLLSEIEEWVELDGYHPDRELQVVEGIIEYLGQGTIIHKDEQEPGEPGTVY